MGSKPTPSKYYWGTNCQIITVRRVHVKATTRPLTALTRLGRRSNHKTEKKRTKGRKTTGVTTPNQKKKKKKKTIPGGLKTSGFRGKVHTLEEK